MPRQRRASPSRAAARPASRPSPPPVQQKQPVLVAPGPTAVGQPVPSQGPGLMAQMAATAGGVAIGSAVGHTVGHALTGAFSGGSSEPAQVQHEQSLQPQAPVQQQYAGPCDREFQQFIRCSQEQADLALCSGYNELLKECKLRYNV